MKISSIFFAIVIVLFLLPFAVVKLNEEKLDSLSGFELAFGGNVVAPTLDQVGKSLNLDSSQFENLPGAEMLSQEPVKAPLKPLALISLILAVIGLLTSLFLTSKNFVIPSLSGLLGLILLLFKGDIKAVLETLMEGLEVIQPVGQSLQMNLVHTPTLWYWLALLSFLLAAVFAWLAGRKSPVTKEQISRIIPDKVENVAGKAMDKIVATGSDLASKLDDAVDKVKDKVEDAKLGEKIDSAVDKVKDKIADAKLGEKIDSAVDKVKDKIADAKLGEKIDSAVDKVKEKVEEAKLAEKIENAVDKVKDKIEEVVKPDDNKPA